MKPGRNDMKKALEKLQVNRPLRLPGDGPGLLAPKIAEKEVPPNGAPPEQAAQFEVTHSAKPTSSEAPQNEKAPQKGQHGVSNRPQTEVSRYEATKTELPQSEVARNEAGRFEGDQNELPQDEGATSNAFFRLSPRVFSETLTRNLSGDCFRLFLWLSWRAWRYPNSPGVVRAAVSFIEDETGMGHATASRALKKLRESGLIQLIETDFKRGNLWKISGLACPNRSPDPGTGSKIPQNEVPLKKRRGAPERGTSDLKSSAKPPQNESHLKNYINLRNLSQEDATFFFERVDKFAAPKKREGELRHLDALLAQFKPSNLISAVRYLETKGTLRGESCHSPFSYLAVAADEVLKRIEKGALGKSIIAAPTTELEQAWESSNVEASIALSSFEADLPPAAQEQFLSEFIDKEFPHGFLPPTRVTKSLAAVAWLARRNSHHNPFQLAG